MTVLDRLSQGPAWGPRGLCWWEEVMLSWFSPNAWNVPGASSRGRWVTRGWELCHQLQWGGPRVRLGPALQGREQVGLAVDLGPRGDAQGPSRSSENFLMSRCCVIARPLNGW